jgi:hypothetical protein
MVQRQQSAAAMIVLRAPHEVKTPPSRKNGPIFDLDNHLPVAHHSMWEMPAGETNGKSGAHGDIGNLKTC